MDSRDSGTRHIPSGPRGTPGIGTGRQELNNERGIAPGTRRESLPIAVDALRKLLHDFNTKTGAKMSAIVSRSGVPVAWALPNEAQVDNFATMAATLLGALEVIYATMKVDAPGQVTVESEGGILSIREVTGKMFFVTMAAKRSPALGRAVDDLRTKAKGLLG
jgi:predicted regulator of Ras-like GTPase activity (Roadblock/LC7/MglB family)